MSHHHHDHDCCDCCQDLKRLQWIQIEQNNHIIRLLRILVIEEAPPHLASIQLVFKEIPMPGTTVTLTAVGQTAATVLTGTGSDGNPWTGPLPTATYADDNATAATTDASGVVTAVANGTDNVTATVTTDEGLALTSNPVTATVDIPAPPVTLASVQLSFL